MTEAAVDKMKRKWIRGILPFLLAALFALYAAAAPAEQTEGGGAAASQQAPVLEHVKAAIVYNATDRTVLFSQNANQTMYPAASVKLMTALLAAEHFEHGMDETVTVTYEMVQRVSGINIALKTGEQLRVEDLYAAMVIGNANDAAQALAVLTAGSVGAFVERMNSRAEELGMTHTRYTNPTGMHHDNMVTTAEDLVLLARELYHVSAFMNLCGKETYLIERTNYSAERKISNRNYLVSSLSVGGYYESSATGMNYGSTYEAGGCLVASSMYGGAIYLTVILGGETEAVEKTPASGTGDSETDDGGGAVTTEEPVIEYVVHAFVQAKKLLQWAYKSFSYFRVADAAGVICEVPVRLGKNTDYVALFPDSAVDLFLPADTDLAKDIRVTWELDVQHVNAPVSDGTEMGTLYVYYKDELAAQRKLITRSTVERSVLQYWYQWLAELVETDGFRKAAGAVLLLAVLYILLAAVFRQKKKKKAYRRRLEREREEQRRHRTTGGG